MDPTAVATRRDRDGEGARVHLLHRPSEGQAAGLEIELVYFFFWFREILQIDDR